MGMSDPNYLRPSWDDPPVFGELEIGLLDDRHPTNNPTYSRTANWMNKAK